MCKVRAGAAVVVLTPVLVRDTCWGCLYLLYLDIISTYYLEGVAVVLVTHVLVRAAAPHISPTPQRAREGGGWREPGGEMVGSTTHKHSLPMSFWDELTPHLYV